MAFLTRTALGSHKVSNSAILGTLTLGGSSTTVTNTGRIKVIEDSAARQDRERWDWYRPTITGSFTVPADTTKLKITVIGRGGNGGTGEYKGAGGNGGEGAFSTNIINVAPNSLLNYSIDTTYTTISTITAGAGGRGSNVDVSGNSGKGVSASLTTYGVLSTSTGLQTYGKGGAGGPKTGWGGSSIGSIGGPGAIIIEW